MPTTQSKQHPSNESLEEITQLYWGVCRRYNIDPEHLTVGEAIATLREILMNSSSERLVGKLAWDMQKQIIIGERE